MKFAKILARKSDIGGPESSPPSKSSDLEIDALGRVSRPAENPLGTEPEKKTRIFLKGNDGKFVTADAHRYENPASVDDHEAAAKYHADQADKYEAMGDYSSGAEHRVAANAHKTAAAHMRTGSMAHETWADTAKKASTALRNGDRKRTSLQEVPAPNAGLGSFHSDVS